VAVSFLAGHGAEQLAVSEQESASPIPQHQPPAMTTANIPAEVAGPLEALQRHNAELGRLINTQQQLETQLNENQMVKEVGWRRAGHRARRALCGARVPSSIRCSLVGPPLRPTQELATEPQAVYKLHGRVMVKQDVSEARSTVGSRLEFIQKEL
jgi:chaperonin cofactor prefoldin